MLRSLSSWVRCDRAHAAAPVLRRRRMSFGRGLERLEERRLLSTVGGANQAPVLQGPGTQIVEEGDTLTVPVRATDPDAGQTLTYSLDPGAPAGATIDPTSGLLVWTPPNVQTIYAITVRATDNGSPGLSDAKTFQVMVFDVPPTVQAGVNATINAGAQFARTGSFSDPNPDTWSAVVDYGDGSGDQPLALRPDHTFQLAHAYGAAGNYTVAITIVDSQGFQGRGFFGVQVQAPGTTATQTTGGSPQGQAQSSSVPGQSTGSNSGSTQNLDGIITALRKGHHAKVRIPHGPRAHRHR
jgi:hypothetical protein